MAAGRPPAAATPGTGASQVRDGRPGRRLAVVPVLVVRGRDDVLSSADGDRLAGQAADGDYLELAGAHTFLGTSVFPWRHPSA
jgi:hypothetical protein